MKQPQSSGDHGGSTRSPQAWSPYLKQKSWREKDRLDVAALQRLHAEKNLTAPTPAQQRRALDHREYSGHLPQGPENILVGQQALRRGKREDFLANGLKLFVGHGTAWLLVQSPRLGEIEMLGDIATGVEFPIKRFGFHLA